MDTKIEQVASEIAGKLGAKSELNSTVDRPVILVERIATRRKLADLPPIAIMVEGKEGVDDIEETLKALSVEGPVYVAGVDWETSRKLLDKLRDTDYGVLNHFGDIFKGYLMPASGS